MAHLQYLRPIQTKSSKIGERRSLMAVNSAKSFLGILERSGIVAEDRLKITLSELSRKFKGSVVKLDDLTSHLVQSGLITEWHCGKLLSGRYKGFFLGKYKLLGLLGTGGMSSVYLAEHRISGHKRAIKVLPRKKVADKSYLDRFYREGKAAASLNHNNIVRMYDICSEEKEKHKTHFMVMEFVEGQDLYEKVKETGPLKIETAAELVLQAAAGLAHAHERNVVHRDIKPANLLLANDGAIKILDLGLALLRENDEESLTVMHGEKVMGTADYLSPEQAVDSHDVDRRADIYSLGCTLYYLVVGQPPFPTGSLAQRIAKHRNEYPTPIEDLRLDCPKPLIEICNRMIRKNPDHRFQNCVQLQTALREFLETGQVTLPTPEAEDFADYSPGNSSGNAPDNPFAIDLSVSNSQSSKKLRSSSKKLHSSSKKLKDAAAESDETRAVLPARRELMPIWALVVIIVMSFTALTLCVLIARYLVAQTTHFEGDLDTPIAYNQVDTTRHPAVSPWNIDKQTTRSNDA